MNFDTSCVPLSRKVYFVLQHFVALWQKVLEAQGEVCPFLLSPLCVNWEREASCGIGHFNCMHI